MKETFRAGVLTISDKASRGLRKDESGKAAVEMLEAEGFAIIREKIVPDETREIMETLTFWADSDGLALIVTSGGTGLSPRDLTPQATERVIDFHVPGMAEAMRAQSLKKTPHAMISRAVAGVRGSTLIINLPGSPGGVRENLAVVLPALKHALSKLGGDATDCAAP